MVERESSNELMSILTQMYQFLASQEERPPFGRKSCLAVCMSDGHTALCGSVAKKLGIR